MSTTKALRRSPAAANPRTRVTASVLLALLGVGAVVVALLGPLGIGWIDYHVSAGATDQVRGGDVAGLVLVGPSALAAAWLMARERPGAGALALAPASYGLYMYTQLAISGDLVRYDGNSERWFVLFWALVTACGAILVLAGAQLLRDPEPAPRPRLERITGAYLLAVAAFLTLGLHLPGLADAWRESPTNEEYLADPTVFWVVKLMDLGYVVPIVVAVGAGLLGGHGWARRVLAPAVGWSALLGCSVAGMGLTMLATGAAGASLGLAVGFTVVALLALGLAVAAYVPVIASDDGQTSRDDSGRGRGDR